MSEDPILRFSSMDGTRIPSTPAPRLDPAPPVASVCSAEITLTLTSTPTPTPPPISTPTPTPTPTPNTSTRRTKVTLSDEDRLVLARLCVEHQEQHRHGNKQRFWNEVKKHFSDATGKKLSDPRDSMMSLVKKEERGDSGSGQIDFELKQALHLWKDHLDAMAKDYADRKNTQEELEADRQAAGQPGQNLLLPRPQKRSKDSDLNSISSDSEVEESPAPKRTRISPEIQLLVTTLDNMRQETRTMVQDFCQTIRESIEAFASSRATSSSIPAAPIPALPFQGPSAIDARLNTLESEVRSQSAKMTAILAALNDLKRLNSGGNGEV